LREYQVDQVFELEGDKTGKDGMSNLPPTTEPKISQGGLMDIQSVSAYLGVSVDSVRWLVRTKKIPAGKVGKRLKFRKSDLDRYISEVFGAA